MPFRSKKQQRFMYATKPKGVDLEEWAKGTNFSKLPEKARKKKKKKDKSDLQDFVIPELLEEILSKASAFDDQVKIAFSVPIDEVDEYFNDEEYFEDED